MGGLRVRWLRVSSRKAQCLKKFHSLALACEELPCLI
jgi:hypothetical protein